MPTFEAVLGHPYYKQLLDWDDECISPDLVTISDSLQEGTLVMDTFSPQQVRDHMGGCSLPLMEKFYGKELDQPVAIAT
jgi:hypothetical protein